MVSSLRSTRQQPATPDLLASVCLVLSNDESVWTYQTISLFDLIKRLSSCSAAHLTWRGPHKSGFQKHFRRKHSNLLRKATISRISGANLGITNPKSTQRLQNQVLIIFEVVPSSFGSGVRYTFPPMSSQNSQKPRDKMPELTSTY